jgi:site-specific recombinase XerD
MAYTFALVSAVVGLGRNDYRIEGNRARLRLMEKGDQEKLVWLHRDAEEYLDAYIAAVGIDDQKAPLLQSLDKAQRLSGLALNRRAMLDVVKLRCRAAGLSEESCDHTFRGTGITVF